MAKVIGEPQPWYPELTTVGGILHVVVEHRENSFLAVPINKSRIYSLPEAYLADGYSIGYDGVIDSSQAIEIPGEVWVYAVDNEGHSIPHARADSFVWP